MNYRKKLIEVSLPLAAINAESAREKSIRHGHPSTLHLWWARRPLAACRAVLFSSLVDDPDSDPEYGRPDGTVDEERAGIKRAELFNLIEELVMWENSNNRDVIRTARAEIARCVASRLIETGALKKGDVIGDKTTVGDLVKKGHCRPIVGVFDKKANRVRFKFDVSNLPPAEVVNKFLAEHAPPVLDPFAGGGSIPLEAQRLGLRAYASDLNPVPVLINKAQIEIPPKFAGMPPINPEWQKKSISEKAAKVWEGAQGLAEDVRYYGQWMRDEAEKRIGHLYPKVEITAEMATDRPDLLPYVCEELTVIAWLWARTIRCPNPACGLQMPLARSFSILRKEDFTASVHQEDGRYVVKEDSDGTLPGTVNRKGATCAWCGTHCGFDYVKQQGKTHLMGKDLIGIIVEANRSRLAISPLVNHKAIAEEAIPVWMPDFEMPYNPFSVRPPLYGFTRFCDIHTTRQNAALSCFSSLVPDLRTKILEDTKKNKDDTKLLTEGGSGSISRADAISTFLAFAVDRCANYWSSLTPWGGEFIVQTFGRQALPMIWDFAEANPFSGSTGNWTGAIDWIVRCLLQSVPSCGIGESTQLDATAIDSVNSHIICTDPPYYNNIDYADLSDFFYVWMRHSLFHIYPQLLSTVLVPKTQELVATPYRFDGNKELAKEFFEHGLLLAFEKCRRAQRSEWPLTVFYAFKQAEEGNTDDDGDVASENIGIASTGWETMLEGLIRSGFSIDGTWPLRTERDQGLKTRMNALASSVVLVCRPRPENASLATRKEFLTSMRNELPNALRSLQRGNIAPVDLAQAAIGPGMAVFTRYAKVIESDGSAMTVRTALGLINQSLDEVLAEQEGEFDSDTRWAISWFEQFGMVDGPFGDAETLSKAKNTAINGLVDAGIIIAKSGKVRLVKREELSTDWNPATDKRLTVWEVTQHLIHRLDQQGEMGASELVRQLGSVSEIARDLAYRLYSTCERKKWAQEALAYNSLVVAWPELTKLARAQKTTSTGKQTEMF